MEEVGLNKQLVFRKMGIGLICLSCVLYAGLLGVPFLHLATKEKAVITSTLVIGGEGLFWIGALFVGKELARKYRYYFNPLNWFRKKAKEEDAPTK